MRPSEVEGYVTIQIRIDADTAPLLEELTSPNGKGKLISGLLRVAGERKRAMDAGESAPFDALTRILLEEQERRRRSLKRHGDSQEDDST